MVPKLFTIVQRVCTHCRRTLGYRVWPWTGERTAQTHGLCRGCLERLAEADAVAPAARVPADAAPRAA